MSPDTAVEHRTRLACLLISNGAHVDVVDRAGMSPLQYGHTQVKDNVRRFLDRYIPVAVIAAVAADNDDDDDGGDDGDDNEEEEG